jgi:DNA-binding CsgD family transcriptional regulator/tetratricopeptide (TPR) repeat protein
VAAVIPGDGTYSGSALFERDDVTASCAGLLDDALRGVGRTLFVVAGPGLGKTSVLAAAAAQAGESSITVRTGHGEPLEQGLPFGLLSQALPALAAAFSGDASTPPDPATARARTFYSALRMFSEQPVPTLIALDDLHWADADSLALLTFLARRIRDLPVAVIGTLRPWPQAAVDTARGLTDDGYAVTHTLQALSTEGAEALLAHRARQALTVALAEPSAVFAADGLLDHCAGNPFLLEQMACLLQAGATLSQVVTLAGARIVLARFAGLPPAHFRFLQAASVLGVRFRPGVAAELARMGDDAADLATEALSRLGLVKDSVDSQLAFTHPLFRQALYDDLPAATRTRMHARVFRLLAARGVSAVEAAEHAIRGALHGDQQAVSIVEDAARAAWSAGATQAGLTHFESAVDLAGELAPPALLLALGDANLALGRAEAAIPVYRRALSAAHPQTSEHLAAHRRTARAMFLNNQLTDAARWFLKAAAAAQNSDRRLAMEIMLDYASSHWAIPPVELLPVAVEARQRAAALGQPMLARAEVVWGFLAFVSGDPDGLAVAWRAVDQCRLADADQTWYWNGLITHAHLACFAEQFGEAEQAFDEVICSADRDGALMVAASARLSSVDYLWRQGRLKEALAMLKGARDIAEFGPSLNAAVGMGHALVLQTLGRDAESRRWWELAQRSVRESAGWALKTYLEFIAARHATQAGDGHQASAWYLRAEESARAAGVAEPCVIPWARDAILAHLRVRRVDDAKRVLGWLQEPVLRLPCRWPSIAVHAGEAALAEFAGNRPAARDNYEAAMALHDEVNLPVDKTRTMLAYGAFERRSGLPAHARQLLSDAVMLADQTGAVALGDLAAQELRVAGGRRRRVQKPSELTPQEARVAQLAALGCSNAEIARELVISVKTVETHLRHIFAKLSIRSRRELRMLMPDSMHESPPPR